jgi:hypothetical protein
VTSNTSARVTLDHYSPTLETATGYIAVPPSIAGAVVGLPVLSVLSATDPDFAAMQVTALTPFPDGYRFLAKWPNPLHHRVGGGQMTVRTTLNLSCGDSGTKTVESDTRIDFCFDGDSFQWVSAGDACTICVIIAEMAPSPIVSNNLGDDLPLGRVLRMRVVEVARTAEQVLLFAENDAGPSAEYEWRVSGGTLKRIADDVVLWTLPDAAHADERPFGQVAVWNDAGAVVENFVWAAA